MLTHRLTTPDGEEHTFTSSASRVCAVVWRLSTSEAMRDIDRIVAGAKKSRRFFALRAIIAGTAPETWQREGESDAIYAARRARQKAAARSGTFRKDTETEYLAALRSFRLRLLVSEGERGLYGWRVRWFVRPRHAARFLRGLELDRRIEGATMMTSEGVTDDAA